MSHPIIVAVAVAYNNLIISKPRPARHGDIIASLYDVNKLAAATCIQGFLTSDGEFVNRQAAKALLKINEQPTIDHPSVHPYEAFSEDVW